MLWSEAGAIGMMQQPAGLVAWFGRSRYNVESRETFRNILGYLILSVSS